MADRIDGTERGIYPISVTPFLDDGTVDTESMDRLTDYFVALGVPGVTLLGIMGEATKLSDAESLALVARVAKRSAGRFKIIAGVNQGGLDGFRDFTSAVMDAGASGIMVAPIASLKTEEQVIGYFGRIVSMIGADVPIVLQDYPFSTGVTMSVATIARLVEELSSIKILKHEEGSALGKITRLRAQEAAGSGACGRRRISILVGNSGLHLPQELARGVDGANTGVAFPEMLIEVCRRFFAGERDRAEDLYDVFLPLIRHEWQPGIGLAIRKEIFRRRGLIRSARTRAPGPSLDATDQEELSRLLARLGRRIRQSGEDGLIRGYRIGAEG